MQPDQNEGYSVSFSLSWMYTCVLKHQMEYLQIWIVTNKKDSLFDLLFSW